MATKRTRRTRGMLHITLDSLDIPQMLDFISGWRLPRGEFEQSRSRWESWEDYMVTYEAVRDELLASSFGQMADGCAPFAERVYQLHGTTPPPWFDGLD